MGKYHVEGIREFFYSLDVQADNSHEAYDIAEKTPIEQWTDLSDNHNIVIQDVISEDNDGFPVFESALIEEE